MSATTTLSSPDAILFDAFGTLFDVRAVRGADVSRSRGTVVAVVATQANRILATAHARRSGRRPLSPFRDITLDALRFAARRSRAEQRGRDDGRIRVPVDLSRYGARAAQAARSTPRPPLGILSNGTPQMLDIAIKAPACRAVRSRAVGRHRARVQAGSPPPTRSLRRVRTEPARHRVRVVERVGRRRRRLVRLHDVLAQPHGRARRGTRRAARQPAPAWPTCSHSSPPRLRPADPQTARPPGCMTFTSAAAFPFTETATDRPRR